MSRREDRGKGTPTATRRTSPPRRPVFSYDDGRFDAAHGARLSDDDVEFGKAVHQFKHDKGKPNPSWPEVLGVLGSLGYSKPGPAPGGDENEFAEAVAQFKRDNCRPYPSFSEILAVAKSLGYRKTEKPSLLQVSDDKPPVLSPDGKQPISGANSLPAHVFN